MIPGCPYVCMAWLGRRTRLPVRVPATPLHVTTLFTKQYKLVPVQAGS